MLCMNCGRDHQMEMDLVENAKSVVLGIVTAHELDNEGDAYMLLSGYLEDATKAGASLNTAWAMLFSASTLWVAALVDLHACHHGQTMMEAISDFALAQANRPLQ